MDERRRFSIWLVICLLVSNLAVGTLSLFFLKKVNERYGVLFTDSIPALNGLRTLTREMSFVQRLARRIVDPANEPTWKDLLPQMAQASVKVRELAREISLTPPFKDSNQAMQIMDGGQKYEARVKEFIALAEAGKLAEANRFNVEILRPTYDDYQATVEGAAEYVERHVSELRDQYTQDSQFFGGLLLVLGGWPLLAGGLFVIVLALIVTSLLITVFLPKFDLTRRLLGKGMDR
ncbi:MAG TPA: MCP four helix bundle domain-containing protein [Lacunisphaera sp.]|nr:MCP four helix bundle domain-containing protein [Lacunisphaera sp.]